MECWSIGAGTFEYSNSIISFIITPSLQHSITPLPVDLKKTEIISAYLSAFF
jgi:hypothetical protein